MITYRYRMHQEDLAKTVRKMVQTLSWKQKDGMSAGNEGGRIPAEIQRFFELRNTDIKESAGSASSSKMSGALPLCMTGH